MPGVYAHFLFGMEVLRQLPPDVRSVVERHRQEYCLGLQGPDIFFYYRPFRKNAVNRTARLVHKATAAEFLKRAESVLDSTDDDRAVSYILGFICHFVLDSSCHPYIKRTMRSPGPSHTEMELEFDRFLIGAQRFSTAQLSPRRMLAVAPESCASVSLLYPGIAPKQVYKSARTMQHCLSALHSHRKTTRLMLRALSFSLRSLRILSGLVENSETGERCRDSDRVLQSVFSGSVKDATELITGFGRSLNSREPLSVGFNRDFG